MRPRTIIDIQTCIQIVNLGGAEKTKEQKELLVMLCDLAKAEIKKIHKLESDEFSAP